MRSILGLRSLSVRARYRVPRNRASPSGTYATVSSMAEGQNMESEVLVDVKGNVAFLTLNRPKALNSLSTVMVRQLLALNKTYSQQTPQQNGSLPVSCVVVRGAGGKAFCAGGDVKEVVIRAREGDFANGTNFFRIEYHNNAAIAALPVPYIAIIDGIVMGGGVGVSYHGHFRVATERTVLAMPESGIGLFPDVGASFFLHRLPGHLGRYMGLTGQRLTGAEVKDAGFATHLIPSARLPDLERGLIALGPKAADLSEVNSLLCSLEQPPAALSPLKEWKLALINAHFGAGGVAEVVASLEAGVAAAEAQAGGAGATGSEQVRAFLRDTLAALRRSSPLSHVLTWEMLRRSAAAHMNLRQCLEMEFILAVRCVRGEADFLEGVRALLIDKDNKPHWRFATAKQVPPEVVAGLFEPLPDEAPLFGPTPASRM